MDALADIIDNKRPDLEIALERPMVVTVADHPIHCRCFTYANHQRWMALMATTLVEFHEILKTLDWPEKAKDLQSIRQRFMVAFGQAKLYRQIISLLQKTLLREPGNQYWRWHLRRFRRSVTVQQVIDLFLYCYLFNYEAVKKNVTSLLEIMGLVKSQATYSSSSTRNLGGTRNGPAKPRFPNSPFISRDGGKVTINRKPRKRTSLVFAKGDGNGNN